jgi:hypothetical protein
MSARRTTTVASRIVTATAGALVIGAASMASSAGSFSRDADAGFSRAAGVDGASWQGVLPGGASWQGVAPAGASWQGVGTDGASWQ